MVFLQPLIGILTLGFASLLSYDIQGVIKAYDLCTLVAVFGGDYSKTHHFDAYFVCPSFVRFVGDFVVGGDVLDGGMEL